MRVVTHDRNDVLDLAIGVEQHLCFGRLEINRTTRPACLVQGLKQLVQILDVRLQGLVHFVIRFCLTG